MGVSLTDREASLTGHIVAQIKCAMCKKVELSSEAHPEIEFVREGWREQTENVVYCPGCVVRQHEGALGYLKPKQ